MKKSILITGATGGLGQIIAKGLIKDGFRVILHGNSNFNQIESLLAEFPDETEWFKADLNDLNAIDLFSDLKGRVDGVIHCAGIASAGMSWKISKEEFKKVNLINYEAPFYISQLFIPEMRQKRWGRIIFFSSVVAQKGIPGTAAYGASKSALIGLTKTLASELGPSGITVNCIAPGYMDNGMIREIPDDTRAQIIENTPIQSLGDSNGIYQIVKMLLSNDSSFMTGEIISINGGYRM